MIGQPRDEHETWLQRRGPYRVVCWTLSALTFVAGPVVGMTADAQLGAAIWLASAVLALIPFASHRHQASPTEDRPGD